MVSLLLSASPGASGSSHDPLLLLLDPCSRERVTIKKRFSILPTQLPAMEY